MKWTEHSGPTRDVSYYDHIISETPLGKIFIEWKSWKESTSYDIMMEGMWIATEYSLEHAKKTAEEYLISKYKELYNFLNEEKLFTKNEVINMCKEAVGLWRDPHDKKVYLNKNHFGEWINKKINDV